MAGMFMTISFLETPMKFQVEGVTLPVALGLGKLMFGLSAKLQWVFMILILSFLFINRKNHTKVDFFIILILILILSLEQFWMLPELDARVDILSSGGSLPPTPLHNYFIYSETAKAILLITAIILQFKTQPNRL
ncbi:MAG: hypothetical protein JO178_15670 [Chryseobacterium sp.]|nr:hypothetical protein [Chryseobacterium sp.]